MTCKLLVLALLAVAVIGVVIYFLKNIGFNKEFKEESEALDKDIDGIERFESRKKDVWANWIDKPTGD